VDWVEDRNVVVTLIVPEPTGAALAAAGAGMFLLRRRRGAAPSR